MNPHAKSVFASAARRMDLAKCLLEEVATGGPTGLLGDAYAEVLRACGELQAAVQILELEKIVADAERPVLRLVK